MSSFRARETFLHRVLKCCNEGTGAKLVFDERTETRWPASVWAAATVYEECYHLVKTCQSSVKVVLRVDASVFAGEHKRTLGQ